MANACGQGGAPDVSGREYFLDVVSPQFPCGAAWLANALLELGVPIGDLWSFDTAHEWALEPDGSQRYVAERLPWRQTLASLELGRRFEFNPAQLTRFSHMFPWHVDFAPRIVFMVRDPRDMLYSEWQRQRRNLALQEDVGFDEFTRLPFESGPISNADLLWMHLSCWMHHAAVRPDRVLLLRFEDWKHAPAQALAEVCAWACVAASVSAVQAAVDASDVARLQALEASLDASSEPTRQFNRRGQVFEWTERPSPDGGCAFGPQWRSLFERLGYQPASVAVSRSTDFDTREVLAWRHLAHPDGVSRWEALIDQWKFR